MSVFRTCIGLVFVFLNLGGLARADLLSESRLKLNPGGDEGTSARRWSAAWSVASGGEGYAEGRDEAVAAYTFFRADFHFEFVKMLKFHAEPRADFYSARLQERLESDDEMRSKIKLGYAYLSLTPVSFFELNAGAISQEYLNSHLLVSTHRSFIGAQEVLGKSFSFNGGTFEPALIAEQTIPVSYSMDSERESKEAMPSFQTQALRLSGSLKDRVNWNVIGGHYSWSNLPDKVAFDSATMGNSPENNVIAAGSKFKFGFDGYFLSSEFCACELLPIGGLAFEFQRVHNSRADDGLGDAQSWGIGPHFTFGQMVLDLRYRRYFIERDTTVARYVSSSFGNTNRMGDNVEFKLDFNKYKFAVIGEWLNAIPMRDDAVQNTMTMFKLGVESHYAPF